MQDSSLSDKAPISALLLPASIAASIGITFSFDPEAGFLLGHLGALVCAAWALIIFVLAIRAAIGRRWRRGLWLIAILIVATPLNILLLFAGDYVHLAIRWPAYRSQVEASDGLHPVFFDWGLYGMFWNGVRRTLVYYPDQSPPEAHDFRNRETSSWATRTHLVGRFYLIEASD